VLEDRQMPSTFTVMEATDNGPTMAGQMLTATSGDLRYCIEKADVSHTGKSNTIVFSPKVFGTAQTIDLTSSLGPLVVNGSLPLTIKGPAGGKYGPLLKINGLDADQVFALFSGLALSNLAITHGSGRSSGGIFINDGVTVTLTRCTLSYNASSGEFAGGGILNRGTATLTSCTLSDNSASVSSGGIRNEGRVTLTNCTLSNNSAAAHGGGIENLGTAMLTSCTLSNNSAAGDGGGIYDLGGTATLANCTFNNDLANTGGGIYVNSTATLTGCTLSNNSAANHGGGIYNQGMATLTNCTLSNNSASMSGGGINNAATATLTNCTLSNNSATKGGGIFNGATLNLTNTLVAANTASTGPDIDGAVTSADHDLIANDSGTSFPHGSGGSQLGTSSNPIDPQLGPLQNNGGSTPTEALLPGSLAIGNADNAAAPKTDQRGDPRNHNKPTDIGAFET